mmetsp:Transcript_13745/g.34985  ORF Transcript_13745/g.34985 Transcript_13745/m.34985 type:complete len:247 (-) Transcript_13745:312-1052(-)
MVPGQLPLHGAIRAGREGAMARQRGGGGRVGAAPRPCAGGPAARLRLDLPRGRLAAAHGDVGHLPPPPRGAALPRAADGASLWPDALARAPLYRHARALLRRRAAAAARRVPRAGGGHVPGALSSRQLRHALVGRLRLPAALLVPPAAARAASLHRLRLRLRTATARPPRRGRARAAAAARVGGRGGAQRRAAVCPHCRGRVRARGAPRHRGGERQHARPRVRGEVGPVPAAQARVGRGRLRLRRR